MVGGGGDLLPIDEGILKALKAWDSMFEKISGEADKIRDTILNWFGLNPDGTVFDPKRWEENLSLIGAIGTAILSWKISSGFAKALTALGFGDKASNLRAALGFTIALTGIWFAYRGVSALIDGNGDWIDWLQALGGAVAGVVGILSVLKETGIYNVLGAGKSIVAAIGFTLLLTSMGLLIEGIKEKDVKKAIMGAIGAFGGVITIAVPLVLNLKNIGAAAGSVAAGEATKGVAEMAGQMSLFDNATTKANMSLSKFVTKVGLGTAGAIGWTASMYGAYDGARKAANGIDDYNFSIVEMGGSMVAATGSAALLGSQIGGPLGAAVGAGIGLFTSMGAAIVGTTVKSLNLTEINKELKAQQERINKVISEEIEPLRRAREEREKANSAVAHNVDISKLALSNLRNLIDDNGKIKGRYEDVKLALDKLNESIGTNFDIEGDQITANGTLIGSFKELEEHILSASDAYVNSSAKNSAAAKKNAAYDNVTQQSRALEKLREEKKKAEDELNSLLDYADKHPIAFRLDGTSDSIKTATDNLNRLTAEVDTASAELAQYQQEMNMTEDQIAIQQLKTKEIFESLSPAYQKAVELVDEAQKRGIKASLDTVEELVGISTKNYTQMIKDGNQEVWTDWENGSAMVKAEILRQVSTIETLTPEVVGKWGSMFEQSEKEANLMLSKLEPDVRKNIVTSLVTTNGYKPQYKEALKSLASEGQLEFAKELEKLPVETRTDIMAAITETDGDVEQFKYAWTNLAEKAPQEYEAALSKLPEETRQKVEEVVKKVSEEKQTLESAVRTFSSGWNALKETRVGQFARDMVDTYVGGIKIKAGSVSSAVGSLTNLITTGFNNLNTHYLGERVTDGISTGMKNRSWSITGAVSKLTSLIPTTFKSLLGINSPSKVMRYWAGSIPEGIAAGIDRNTNWVTDSVKDLVSGITVTAKDTLEGQQMALNNQIRDNIEFQSTATISGTVQNNMKELIAEAVTNANVNVNIEAKTEEGVIVRKATDGINSYIRQTGEMPFPVLI